MGKAFGEVRPAATMMVVGLADPRMKIEIEVTALRRKARSPQEEGEGVPSQEVRGLAPFSVCGKRCLSPFRPDSQVNDVSRLREVRRVLPGS